MNEITKRKVNPITPDEAEEKKKIDIPDYVIESVNYLLVKNISKGQSAFFQGDLIEEILKRAPEITREDIFKDNMLDFEPLYKDSGWSVQYDKPGYNEDYEANFSFRRKLRI